MSDHAVLIPSAHGPVSAIVSEPEDEAHATLILLPGGGPPARAGINSVWTRVARALAGGGVRVLRFDMAGEGDSVLVGRDVQRRFAWRRDTDLALLRDVAAWLRGRIGAPELLVAGSCYGARVALDWAAGDGDTRGAFVAVPYLWNRPPPSAQVPKRTRSQRLRDALRLRRELEAWELDSPPVDVVEGVRVSLSRGPVWMLVGEKDRQDAHVVREQLGAAGAQLEIETVAGAMLHPVGSQHSQAEVARRLTDRVLAAVRDGRCSSGS